VQEQSKVRVTLYGGEEVELKDPWVHGDSIGGLRDVWSGRSQRWVPSAWGVPLDSAAVVETRHTDALKTALVVYLAAGAVGMVILFASGPWFPDN
jgi:hypothetical protein